MMAKLWTWLPLWGKVLLVVASLGTLALLVYWVVKHIFLIIALVIVVSLVLYELGWLTRTKHRKGRYRQEDNPQNAPQDELQLREKYPPLYRATEDSSLDPFFKGWIGEQDTILAQMLTLDPKQYHCFSNLLVPTDARFTQIDHVIVSQYGVFVVETKYRKEGWIFGSPDDRFWTIKIFNSKPIRFQNPLRQNYRHTKAIEGFCAIDHSKIHSVVVFRGDCEFKTPMPENVVRGLDYPGYIKSKKQVLLNDAQVDSVCNCLKAFKDDIPAQEIKNQYNSPDICPRCGGRLLERTTRRGEAAGQRFIGCENYPKCRFTRKLETP